MAVSVTLKAVVMKVSVFLMSRPFDSFHPLSAELAGKVTVSQRNDIHGDFFLAPSAVVCYLLVCHNSK